MKRIILFSCFLLLASFSFALPNIKLYEDGEFVYKIDMDKIFDANEELIYTIHNGKLYNAEGDDYEGTISEQNNRLIFRLYYNDELVVTSEYSSASGTLLQETSYWFGKTVTEYDEKTGLKQRTMYYDEDDSLDSYTLYEYEKRKLSKELDYTADNSLDGYTQYTYDKKTGNKVLESVFAADKHLLRSYEYDPKTEKQIKATKYNDNGSLKAETFYDKKTENPIERIVYENGKRSVKWTFLKFDHNGQYILNESFYLNSQFVWYSALEKYAEESQKAPIDWNENYSAIVHKYNFTQRDDGYSYIVELINKHYISSRSVTLCNKNSDFYYCFDTDENDEIDLSSCYEIELIKKKRDYSAMNKSGACKGPFGFDIGMTYEEVKAACDGDNLEHIGDDRYYVKPKKSHPLFEKYIVWISDSYGLYYIKAISRDIYSSVYGTEAKREFDKILSPLERKYGKFQKTDSIKSDYYLKDEQYWLSALRDGARTYRAEWYVTKDNYLDFDGLCGILLGINATTSSEAYVWLEYEFLNYDDAKEALNDVL